MSADAAPEPARPAPRTERTIITDASVPSLPRHVKLRLDETRNRWVLLAPERVLMPDETALEIVKMLDGTRSVGAIADDLATRYLADRDTISRDVCAMLQDLADKGFLAA